MFGNLRSSVSVMTFCTTSSRADTARTRRRLLRPALAPAPLRERAGRHARDTGTLLKDRKQTLATGAGLQDSQRSNAAVAQRVSARHPVDLHKGYHVGRRGQGWHHRLSVRREVAPVGPRDWATPGRRDGATVSRLQEPLMHYSCDASTRLLRGRPQACRRHPRLPLPPFTGYK
jgi:hypothetical protein